MDKMIVTMMLGKEAKRKKTLNDSSMFRDHGSADIEFYGYDERKVNAFFMFFLPFFPFLSSA